MTLKSAMKLFYFDDRTIVNVFYRIVAWIQTSAGRLQQEHEEQRAKAERPNPSVGGQVFLVDIRGPFTMTSDLTRVTSRPDTCLEQTFCDMNSEETRNDTEQQKPRESLQINQWQSMKIGDNRWKPIICEKILWLSIDYWLANINRYQLTNSID